MHTSSSSSAVQVSFECEKIDFKNQFTPRLTRSKIENINHSRVHFFVLLQTEDKVW
jgi:hypothetical protein